MTEFRPVILHRDNSFCVHLPEWNISGEGKTLEEAYRHFEKEKAAYQERTKKFGLAEVSPEPYPALRHGCLLRDLGVFFAKVATCTFAVLFVLILLLPHLSAAVRNVVMPRAASTLTHWAIDLPTKINARLDRLSPEEQQQMQAQWNRLLERTAPARALLFPSEAAKGKK